MSTPKLQDLIQDFKIKNSQGDLQVAIRGIAHDSRKVGPGFIFVCIEGYKTDGHSYIAQAVEQGAAALLVEKDPLGLGLPPEVLNKVSWVQADNTRTALAWVSARFFGFPAGQLTMIGVTGTNGKTTTTHLIEAILKSRGHRVGLIGTIHNKIGDEVLPVTNTTPLPLELQELLAMMVEKGADYAVMEVSSHALDLGRVEACEFDIAVFTNLTQDHLDFHENMENYRAAKTKLFANLNPQGGKGHPKYGIINSDDPAGQYILEKSQGQVITYGIKHDAQVKAGSVSVKAGGVSFTVDTPWGKEDFNLRLTGMFSVYNALAAISVGLVEKLDLAVIKQVLEGVSGVAGRFELIDEGQNFGVIVDYAHTPDSLENILNTAREFVKGRIITVFGCGGDRDRTKRPIMGGISARLSSYTVITSDNPRSEDPEAILREVEAGVKEVVGPEKYTKLVDRREAIAYAIKLAGPDDLVIIAGKGHETYQIIGAKTLPFDDREVARRCLRSLLTD
ncbi:MAG: UDP-N-acetylmuramoyl-L-alanyl-D-glutamate--2,6-diaminopimelate ligase [Clostridia bacterium]|nr:UDP-N-acetylmuramoyl-L-alanyl-D-glutamate--2,6-diaminopimelate ligase [Clostridia bacterium]